MDNNELKKKLGLKIKEYRKMLNLTQESFSEKINRTQRQVSLMELGKSFPSPDALVNIAKIFNCQVKDLFDFELLDDTEDIKTKLIDMINNYPDNKLKTLYIIGKYL